VLPAARVPGRRLRGWSRPCPGTPRIACRRTPAPPLCHAVPSPPDGSPARLPSPCHSSRVGEMTSGTEWPPGNFDNEKLMYSHPEVGSACMVRVGRRFRHEHLG
jgi:hypothetical protein